LTKRSIASGGISGLVCRMRKQHWLGATWIAAGVAFWSGSAPAQDAATAGALFDRGVADLQAGRFDSACPAIEESQQLDPHPGTLFTLAECQARWGKVASAVAHYQDYLGVVSRLPASQQARHHDREATANAQLAKLKPSVPTLTLVLPANAPPGTTVTRNGVLLQAAALKLALPVDPGEYVIVTSAPGAEDRSITLSIRLGEAKRVPLEVPQRPVAPKAPLAGGSPPDADTRVPGAKSAPVPTSKVPAYIAGSVGIAGIAVGTVTGILVFGKKTTVNNGCTGDSCNPSGLSAANSGKQLATVSNIAFGVGIAGLATGAILLLAQPKSESSAEALHSSWQPLVASAPGGAWAGLERRW
jgi:hypothetical protein